MPINNPSGPPRWVTILILLASLGVCVSLLLYNYQGGGRFQNGGLLTGGFLLLLFVLTGTGVLQFPRGLNVPFFEV